MLLSHSVSPETVRTRWNDVVGGHQCVEVLGRLQITGATKQPE